jgi:hypothetical protein
MESKGEGGERVKKPPKKPTFKKKSTPPTSYFLKFHCK